MKKEGFGGYIISEIDYTPKLLLQELKSCGGKEIKILGHNIFNHLLLEKINFTSLKKIIFLLWQAVPLAWLPKDFVFKKSGTLIGIARK